MKGRLEGSSVILGPDGAALHEQGGFGRMERGGLRLSPEEALYLVHRQKIEVEGRDFDRLLSAFPDRPGLLRSFLVYRDIRERGFAVQPGVGHFRLFRRGERPGTGRSRLLVTVLSERDAVDFQAVMGEVETSDHMRKDHVLAVVDDEGELTYYGVKVTDLPVIAPAPSYPSIGGTLSGWNVILHAPIPQAVTDSWFGTPLDEERLVLSPVEALHLMNGGALTISADGGILSPENYFAGALGSDPGLAEKAAVYTDLRGRGYIPRTGYKFGHHFRVYAGDRSHSSLLVHAVPQGETMSVSVISRSVRLAHSVKKKMLFARVHPSGIRYIEFGRMKL
ncbi:MAG TPA: tRNA-intron lyase [Methanomicrobiales archaeon]|nr:tRNA-intron lyase [Methanomicrobiales archaeon]